MAEQKVKLKAIIVNISIANASNYKEIELKEVNNYLHEGYTIVNQFSNISSSDPPRIYLTFILGRKEPRTGRRFST